MRRRAASMSWWVIACLAIVAVLISASCGGSDDSGKCTLDGKIVCENGGVCLAGPDGEPACFCNTATEGGCATGTVCEEVPGSTPACFAPVTVGGKVFDLATNKPIAGARIVGRDASFAALTGVAVTDAQGRYSLAVPVPRDKDGKPKELQIFLRADAQAYVTFPTAPRVSLPVEVSKATGSPPHLETAATDIGMVALANASGLGTVSGQVLSKVPVGTLVVAGGAANMGGGATGVADVDGTYTVFNVPAGSVTVRGYKVGVELAEAKATVKAGEIAVGVNLADKGEAKATVSGSIQIVNGGMGTDTSVILAVDETFDPKAARGEAPPGLRVTGVTGSFSLKNVPSGNYVVLAAFENDFLTRDPDTAIGGTSLVHVTVAGSNVSFSEGFKVTGSLQVISPDGEEVVSGTPKFVWAPDSGEDHYEVHVFDAFGNEVWADTNVPSNNKEVSVTYGGPALKSGGLYQFRAISIKNGGSAIAMTEDLRGVFLYK